MKGNTPEQGNWKEQTMRKDIKNVWCSRRAWPIQIALQLTYENVMHTHKDVFVLMCAGVYVCNLKETNLCALNTQIIIQTSMYKYVYTYIYIWITVHICMYVLASFMCRNSSHETMTVKMFWHKNCPSTRCHNRVFQVK